MKASDDYDHDYDANDEEKRARCSKRGEDEESRDVVSVVFCEAVRGEEERVEAEEERDYESYEINENDDVIESYVLKSETEDEEDEDDDDEGESSSSEGVRELLRRLTVRDDDDDDERRKLTKEQPRIKLETRDIKGIAKYIGSDECKNVVVMCGAGVSVSAGIPDFRTPGTGLYDNLQKYDLPYPQAVFEIGFFDENPKPFYALASHLAPGKFEPTKTHRFIKKLEEHGKLRRCFTQNIDSLETKAGVSEEFVVAAHGNFDSAKCRNGHEQDIKIVLEHVERGEPMKCAKCSKWVKPDIVFFGENLPERFAKLAKIDFNRENCDLLIVLGTSLQVQPFASLIEYPETDTPRILINREKVGEIPTRRSFFERGIGRGRGFDFSPHGKREDALFLGDCDDGVVEICKHLGWEI